MAAQIKSSNQMYYITNEFNNTISAGGGGCINAILKDESAKQDLQCIVNSMMLLKKEGAHYRNHYGLCSDYTFSC